ncbi:hypothetical protein Pint_13231 [Pistacia integerrima]|uniref:Uncharacterized protein n=1 Tax=Pistacia integerrima TaxID=434235 RepID=A0ACC0Y5Y6_9ROSI|nr:hypothetical protein Pint_13231 [Pistacia integerrima]
MVGVTEVRNDSSDLYTIVAIAPPLGTIAPPDSYLTSMVYKGVPSSSMWLQVKLKASVSSL